MAIKYAIIGTGALGGYYGGKLAKANRVVHFLMKSDFEHVRNNGLRVDSVNGDFHLAKVNAWKKTTEMPRCDVILVCLKTTENHLLPDLIRPILHSESVVLLLQNGLNLEEDLCQQMPGVSIGGGLAFLCSNKIGAGHISHLDFGRLIIGSYNISDSEILLKVVDDLKEAGIPTELSPDLRYARWHKLVWNIPFNGMTVVLQTTTDQLMANHETRELSRDLMLEVIAGANQCGVPLKESLADHMIEMTIKMKPYAPSMKLDFDRRKPMEIEYIYSKPVQIAAAAGYSMHKVSMLEKQLRFIQENLKK
jgi:2-dehydropantoate 2-reductase